MKKYLVIGKPINHSLSPKLHNYWFKLNNINATYEKKQIDEKDIEKTILDLKNNIIDGINVTVPFMPHPLQKLLLFFYFFSLAVL